MAAALSWDSILFLWQQCLLCSQAPSGIFRPNSQVASKCLVGRKGIDRGSSAPTQMNTAPDALSKENSELLHQQQCVMKTDHIVQRTRSPLLYGLNQHNMHINKKSRWGWRGPFPKGNLTRLPWGDPPLLCCSPSLPCFAGLWVFLGNMDEAAPTRPSLQILSLLITGSSAEFMTSWISVLLHGHWLTEKCAFKIAQHDTIAFHLPLPPLWTQSRESPSSFILDNTGIKNIRSSQRYN